MNAVLKALLLGTIACTTIAGTALAQSDYPNRAVTIVSPVAPGGVYSYFARILATRLEKKFGKPFVVENRQGAGTSVGTGSVAKAEPDGYTLLIGGSTPLAINATVFKRLPFDPIKDFAPISLFAKTPEVLVVNAATEIHSVADIARLAKEKPGVLTYATSGPGTALHLEGEMLKIKLGVNITHVPYRGALPALNDLAAGHVTMMFISVAPALPLIQSGKLRVIGVTTAERVQAVPDAPPLSEAGLPGLDAAAWYMVLAPAKTPQPIVDLLHNEIGAIMRDPAVRNDFLRQGMIPVDSPPLDKLKPFIEAEIAHWGDVARKAGVAGIQ
jgi:tripartite-type tricarboxylate transporter receptor subunit TctC